MTYNIDRDYSGRAGVTILELLVVIGIISLISVLVTVAVDIARAKAKLAAANYDISVISSAMDKLEFDTALWPGQQPPDTVCTDRPGGCPGGNEICGDGCANGLSDPEAGISSSNWGHAGWDGPYIVEIPPDPWGNEYFFDTDYEITVDGDPCAGAGVCLNAAVIGSYGPDGSGNNQYNGDDIIKVLVR